jgi:hypothetical protein
MNLEEEPGVTLAALEEETGLIKNVGPDQWEFLHLSIQELLAASWCVDRVASSGEHYTLSGQPWWQRVWRYMCWMASNPSQLLTPHLESEYEALTAISLARVFSQNLLLERSTVSGFGLYIAKVCERLLKDVDIEPLTPTAASPWRLGGRVTHRGGKSEGEVQAICDLVKSLYHARDGAAGSEVVCRLSNVADERIKSLTTMFEVDGIMSASISHEEGWTEFCIEVKEPRINDREVRQT